jgi:hypothetical protein
MEKPMTECCRFLCATLVAASLLAGCARAVAPTKQTTTTTTIACPPGKTLDSDGMCR